MQPATVTEIQNANNETRSIINLDVCMSQSWQSWGADTGHPMAPDTHDSVIN